VPGRSSVEPATTALRLARDGADARKMNDARTSVIGAGAAAVAGALWAPWYALNFGPQARGAIGAQTDKLPGAVGDFTRQLLSLIPTRIEATAWQAFEKADVVLLVCAMVAVAAALLGRMDVVGLAGGGVVVVTVVAMVDRPLPPEILSLEWGPWLSLVGAAAILAGSRMRSEQPVVVTTPPPDWTRPVAPTSDPARSFPPF
jgi:hypothetical protein